MDYMNLKTTQKNGNNDSSFNLSEKSKYLDLLKTIFCCQEAKKRAELKDTRAVHLTVTPFCFISTKLPISLSKTHMVIAWRNLLFATPDLTLLISDFLYHFGSMSRSVALMMAIPFQNMVARASLPLFGHMWVEFVVCLLCSKKYFSRHSGFPLLSKTNRRFHFIWIELCF